jgi:hypothetical protein
MKSALFCSKRYLKVQQQVKTFLNKQVDFLSLNTAKSPRATGDAIQEILADNFATIVGEKVCGNYSSDFARRAMADLAFEDPDKLYYVVDVKTHRLSTKFNMPNLTSVERLARFYEDDNNYFVLLMIAYDIQGIRAVIDKVTFVPIEFLSWDCLTIGALGWGQIQIANSNEIMINPANTRKQWMLELCDTLLEFYPKEISKIDKRIAHFQKIRTQWVKRKES